MRSFFPDFPLNFYVVGLVVTLLILPMCLCSDLRVFAHLSAVANVLTTVGLVLVFAYLFTSGMHAVTEFPAITKPSSFMVGFSIVMFSFEGISLVSGQ